MKINYSPRPFLKWVGGKTQLLPSLLPLIPKEFNTYHEPFLGGGAMFFALQPGQAILSDANANLIDNYLAVKTEIDTLVDELQIIEKKYLEHVRNENYNPKNEWYLAEKYFYDARFEFNNPPTCTIIDAVWIAKHMIFLNKTCFNGLYRENKSGQFNSPFGKYKNPKICDEENLRACSKALQAAELKIASFAESLSLVQEGDFVYADPPYQPVSKTAKFTSYTSGGFDWKKQEELKEWMDEITNRKARMMISNSDTPEIRQLYSAYNITTVEARRNVNSKGEKRGKVNEVVIRNYDR